MVAITTTTLPLIGASPCPLERVTMPDKKPSLRRRRTQALPRRSRPQSRPGRHIPAASAPPSSPASRASSAASPATPAPSARPTASTNTPPTPSQSWPANPAAAGWWHVYPDDILGKVVDVIELEADSRAVRNFQL